MIHAGDLVADGFDDNLWAEWCAGLGFIGSSIPSLPAPGNHDLHPGPNASDALNPLRAPDPWRQHFALPDNGPQALRGQAYYLDYQGVRLIALDTNPIKDTPEPDSEKAQAGDQEVAWLEAVLRDNPNRWTLVFSHHPVYPVAKRRARFLELERRLVPLYDKYGVDVVLQGHDHGYGRTHKLLGGKVVSSPGPPRAAVPADLYTPCTYDAEVYHMNTRALTISAVAVCSFLEYSVAYKSRRATRKFRGFRNRVRVRSASAVTQKRPLMVT